MKHATTSASFSHEPISRPTPNGGGARRAVQCLARSIGLVLLSLLGVGASYADVLPAPRQLSPHAWAWIGPYEGPSKANRGFRMNLGFVVGEEAVAVIDSGYSPDMAEAMQQISNATIMAVDHSKFSTTSMPDSLFSVPLREGGLVATDRQPGPEFAPMLRPFRVLTP